MNPEMDSLNKMDDQMKRFLILGKLFEDLGNNIFHSSNSDLEKLPKLVFCKIVEELDLKDIPKIFLLNKHIFNFMWNSERASKNSFFLRILNKCDSNIIASNLVDLN